MPPASLINQANPSPQANAPIATSAVPAENESVPGRDSVAIWNQAPGVSASVPRGREAVVNTPLSGAELKQRILSDFTRLLDNYGMLAQRNAYGRVSYRISITLRTTNALTPTDDAFTESIDAEQDPATAELTGTAIERDINSPNVERLRAGLPVPATRKQTDGTIITEHIKYPVDAALADGAEVRITDADPTEKEKLGRRRR